MIRRLRKRFIRITMCSVTAVLLLLSLIVNLAYFISTNAEWNEMLQMICDNQGTIPTHTFLDGTKKDAVRTDEELLKKPDAPTGRFSPETPYSTRYFCLRYGADGTMYSADLTHIAAITEDNTEEFVAAAIRHGPGYGYYSGYKYYVVQHDTDRYMAIFLDCYQEMHAMRVLAAYSLLAVAVCILLVYILVVLFSKKAVAPVIRSVEKQKQFITDASHELKTPITVIATSLKVLEMEVGKQKWIDKAEAQTEKLTELVGELVTLSRMDEEESPLKLKPFPISDAAAETAESFREYAETKELSLELSVTPDIEYCGDEYAIRQLVSILLDNAVKYAIPQTAITFSLEKTKKGIVIRTTNRCEPVDPDDLKRLFDRFYRADKSRSSQTGGFGIGLSIARSIAEGHKGSIKASCPQEGMIAFTVELK